MDSTIAQHSCTRASLICFNLKDYFNSSENKLFFFNELIYGKEFVITLNEKQEGLEIGYLESGIKNYERNWKAGKREGLQNYYYYESGMKVSRSNWKDDKKEGPQIDYDDSGKMLYLLNWKNDKFEIGYYGSRLNLRNKFE